MNNVNQLGSWKFQGCAIVAVLGATGCSAVAAADFSAFYAAGQACVFELRIDGTGGNQVYRDFFDRNGNLVRSLSPAGTGSALTFTNVDTGATLSTTSNGSVTHVTYNADGSNTYATTGHNVLILFPTDVPSGPTTTLYVGRVVFTADSAFNFELLQHRGTATDICAALSQ
jgi:hypothetical protein